MAFLPVPNQSVSGTVGASVIGLAPVNLNVGGAVVSTSNPVPVSPPASGTLPVIVPGSVISVSQGSVATVIIGGSIAASFTPPANQSVSGTVQADVRGSVATVIIGGSIAASFTPPANQSVSGTVNVGNLPTTQNVSGSVVGFQGTNPWIITGSVQGSFSAGNSSVQVLNFPTNQSVSGTVTASVSGQVIIVDTTGADMDLHKQGDNFSAGSDHGIMITGLTDGNPQKFQPLRVASVVSDGTSNENVRLATMATIKAYNGSTWDRIRTGSTTGAILVSQADKVVTSVVSSTPSSMLTGASIFGQLPAGTAVLGSVAALQGTNPWIITGSVQSSTGNSSVQVLNFPANQSVSGTVGAAQIGSWSASVGGTVEVLGTVPVTQSGSWTTSVFTATPGTAIRFSTSIVSTSVTLIAASAAGKRNYITDFWAANTGAATTLLTFKDGSTSILGYTVVPAGGGSNAPGITTPIVAATAQDLTFQPATGTSVLYVTVNGYQI